VRWIAPTGLTGLTPLASVGPITVGPSSREASSATLPRVVVRVDPIQSLLQGKLMLRLLAEQAEVPPPSTNPPSFPHPPSPNNIHNFNLLHCI